MSICVYVYVYIYIYIYVYVCVCIYICNSGANPNNLTYLLTCLPTCLFKRSFALTQLFT